MINWLADLLWEFWEYIRFFFQAPLPVPGVNNIYFDELFDAGLTMGTNVIGRQGTGKTSGLSRHICDHAFRHPEQAVFVLDASGSITDNIITLFHQHDLETGEHQKDRLVYDELGHSEIVVPMPEFSELYGGNYEDQVQRVSNNLVKLAPELVKDAPFLAGLGLREIAPQLFRSLTAIVNEHDEPWQITETKKLIADPKLLKLAVNTYGYKVPQAKWFIERIFLPLSSHEKDLRTFALVAMLGAIETREIRARVGYYRPGWTPNEAIQKGLVVLVNGARLINQKPAQHYLFTQVYSLIMQEINRRTPGDPRDYPVSLVLDEVYSLLSIPGMAEEIGQLSPLYRSRKLQLYVVLQMLSQLSLGLQDKIWALGNIVCFALENKEDAEKMAYQLFKYNPQAVKMPARTLNQNPLTEPEQGQDRFGADWIQQLRFRECVMRRYVSEQQRDQYIRHVAKTKDIPSIPLDESLSEIKEKLLRKRGIPVRDALEVINQRKISVQSKPPQI